MISRAASVRISWSGTGPQLDRKSTRLNSSHSQISYAVFCLKKKKNISKDLNLFTYKITPQLAVLRGDLMLMQLSITTIARDVYRETHLRLSVARIHDETVV